MEWTTTDWSTLNLILGKQYNLSGLVTISFDYADLWSTDAVISFFDSRGRSTQPISLNEFEDELVLNDSTLRKFEKTIDLTDYAGRARLGRITELGIDISGSNEPKTLKLDNIRIQSNASPDQPLDFTLDFNLPDGSLIEEINKSDKAEWDPYSEGENTITKLMLHGMTAREVQDLAPLARSWVHAPRLALQGNAFENQGYDPEQMAYVIGYKGGPAQSLAFEIKASEGSPMVNPAIVVKNWGDREISLALNGTEAKQGKDYRCGFEKKLNGCDLVVWVNVTEEEPVQFEIAQS